MGKFLDWLDDIAGIESGNKAAVRLERLAFVFLILMALSAPHSIAAVQTAWLLGTALWLARFFVRPRPRLIRTTLDAALWTFFGWSVVTAIFSYAPDISVNKLRGALLFLVFYFVVNNLKTARAIKFLAFALVFSCMWSVAWAPVQRIYGRGVEIYGVSAESVFAKGTHFDQETYLRARGKNLSRIDDLPEHQAPPLADGTAIVEADGRKIRTPDELVGEIEKNEVTYLECFLQPAYFPLKVRRADLQPGGNALEKLGIREWKRNRNWRFSGFYSQIITYAEVLQLIASLVFGLLIALDRRRSATGVLLALCFAGTMLAFLLTFTRSAQAGFLAAAAAIVIIYGSRKTFLIFAAIALPLVLIGIFSLRQVREVAVYNQADKSETYRQIVYREGFDLWTDNARNFFLGVGMDSTKRFARDWHLFDDGRLPVSHFHSTPLQLLVERGLPALLLWFWIVWLYGRLLIRQLRITDCRLRSKQRSELEKQRLEPENRTGIRQSASGDSQPVDWQIHGILLGCFGALVGFFVSSLVNYSLGDGEVAMVFYILMGIGVSLCLNQSAKGKSA